MDVISLIIRRLRHKNQNWLAVITGQTGTGKSYSAISIAKIIDEKFTNDQIVYTPEQFMSLLNSGVLKKGSAIVFDEAGVGIPNRDWYTIQNKLVSYVLQTFRHKNLAVIFTTPSLDFIDIHTRKLFHAYIETKSINREIETVICKWFEIEHISRFGKTYFRYPILKNGNKILKIKMISIPKPPEDLVELYEKSKIEYTKVLGLDAEKTIRTTREKIVPKLTRDTILDWANKIPDNIKPTSSNIQNMFGISHHKADQVRSKYWQLKAEQGIPPNLANSIVIKKEENLSKILSQIR